jgi:hypothetical protein
VDFHLDFQSGEPVTKNQHFCYLNPSFSTSPTGRITLFAPILLLAPFQSPTQTIINRWRGLIQRWSYDVEVAQNLPTAPTTPYPLVN